MTSKLIDPTVTAMFDYYASQTFPNASPDEIGWLRHTFLTGAGLTFHLLDLMGALDGADEVRAELAQYIPVSAAAEQRHNH
jgi:hypothetical protein